MLNPEDEVLKDMADAIGKIESIHQFQEQAAELSGIFARSIEGLEKQFAQISMGFLEQAVMLEALIELIDDPDKQKQFHEYVKPRRAALINAINEGADVLSRVITDTQDPVGQVIQTNKSTDE